MASSLVELDLSWVLPQLAVGGSFPMHAAEALSQRFAIRLIVDVRQERCDDERLLREHGIECLHLPIEALSPLLQRQLNQGVQRVLAALARGEKAYIHCEQGVGRSVMLALCVMVALGWDPLEALAWLKFQRPVVSPSPDQLEAFRLWCLEHHRLSPLAWTPPTLEELVDRAYDLDVARSTHPHP